jgi:uncharacterized protein YggT (Ycf19 family)
MPLGDWKSEIKGFGGAIVALVMVAVVASIVATIGGYIISVFNQTGLTHQVYNFFGTIAGPIGSVFSILVVVLIVLALVIVIRVLTQATEET